MEEIPPRLYIYGDVSGFGFFAKAVEYQTLVQVALPGVYFCVFSLAYTYSVIFLATCTPLAEAWEREWVIPLPSPMMYRPG